jgi:hypothetical protein
MISLEDCFAMCGLEEHEIAAIAEHEHVPEIAAAALAGYLLHRKGGEQEICRMIVDDLRAALREKRCGHAVELLMALRHFLSEHPAARIPRAGKALPGGAE